MFAQCSCTIAHRLNMKLDLQSLYGLLCTAVLISWNPATPPLPPHLGSYTRALLVGQEKTTSLYNPLHMHQPRHCWWYHQFLGKLSLNEVSLNIFTGIISPLDFEIYRTIISDWCVPTRVPTLASILTVNNHHSYSHKPGFLWVPCGPTGETQASLI